MKTLLVLLLVLGAISAQLLVGPAATSLNGAVITWESCKLCEIDCELNGVLKCPSNMRYYRYGCHIQAYCFDISSFHPRDYDAAIAFCISKNGCYTHRDGLTDNRADYYVDNNPEVQRRKQAAEAVLAGNSFLNAVLFDSRKFYIEQTKRSCSWYTYPVASEFAAYETLKQKFQQGQISADDAYHTCFTSCGMAFIVLQDFEDQVNAKANALLHGAYSKVTLEAGYTLIKSKLFTIANIPQVFMFYTKLISDAFDIWPLLSSDSKAMEDFVKKTNDQIAKIPNFLGEKAPSQASTNARAELEDRYRYQKITTAHLKYLKVQMDYEGGLRAVKLLNLVNKYTDEAVAELKRYKDIYPNREVETYLPPLRQLAFLDEYVAMLKKFDPDYASDYRIEVTVDKVVASKRVPTDAVLRLLFQGYYRDKLIMFTVAKNTNLPDFTIDFPALEEMRMKEVLFPIWFHVTYNLQTQPSGDFRSKWVVSRTQMQILNPVTAARTNLVQSLVDALRAAGYSVFVF